MFSQSSSAEPLCTEFIPNTDFKEGQTGASPYNDIILSV